MLAVAEVEGVEAPEGQLEHPPIGMLEATAEYVPTGQGVEPVAPIKTATPPVPLAKLPAKTAVHEDKPV